MAACKEGKAVGDVCEKGSYKVSIVVGSGEDKRGKRAKFWATKSEQGSLKKKKCGISGCDSMAQVAGLVWIKGKAEFCYILPLCKDHQSDEKLWYPNHKTTKRDIPLVVVPRKGPRQTGVQEKEGTRYIDGPYEVCNVRGSSSDNGSKKDFWKKYSKRSFPKECRISGCTNDATDGGHMWIKGSWKFCCFILPICHSCNMKREYCFPYYVDTNTDVCLVARNATEDMYEYYYEDLD